MTCRLVTRYLEGRAPHIFRKWTTVFRTLEEHPQEAFTGNYLRVDLTAGTTAAEQFSALHYRTFLGGAAMAAAILMRELRPGATAAVHTGDATSPPSGTQANGRTIRGVALRKTPMELSCVSSS